VLGLLAGGVAAGAGFWVAERRGRHPMLPPSFLRNRPRTAAVLSAGLMGFTFYGTLFVMSLYFQQVRGDSAGLAGVALLPLTVSSTIGPLLLYRPLARRYSHATLLVAGFTCAGAGTLLLGPTGPHTPYLVTAAGLLLTGGASTIAFSALTSLVIASTPDNQAGLGSGLQNTTRQAGALLSVSILGSVFSPAVPGGELTAALAILGVAEAAGVTAGLIARRAKQPGPESPA
jgi:DHA2 family methylenomycin A resistance protein-like MFS transporter